MTASATTETRYRFVDADGHVLEAADRAPGVRGGGFRDRVWHLERDDDGQEWVVADGNRLPANVFTLAGVAGFTDEDKQRALEGVFPYSEVSRRSWDPELRVQAWTRTASRCRCCTRRRCSPSRLGPTSTTRSRPAARTTTGCDHCEQAPGPALRRGGAAAAERRSERGGAAPCREPARHRRRVPAPQPDRRLEALPRRGLRPDLARRERHQPRARVPPLPRRDAARRRAGLRVGMLRMQTELRKTMPDESAAPSPVSRPTSTTWRSRRRSPTPST